MVEDGDEEEVEEVDPPKVLGDLLESLAGAIFLDSGMNLETVWRVFRPLFQSKIGMPITSCIMSWNTTVKPFHRVVVELQTYNG